MCVASYLLLLLATPMHSYDVLMVIGGRYYDHVRQAYIELSTVEVSFLGDSCLRPLDCLGCTMMH